MPELTARPTRGDPLVTDLTFVGERGLFAARWLDGIDAAELPELEAVWDRLARTEGMNPAATHRWRRLLGVRLQCLRATAASSSSEARSQYQRALNQCEELMQELHHAEKGEEAALAEWIGGVHALIRGQLAVPDVAQARTMALSALDRLSGTEQPAYPGILEDARAAHTLAHEPGECATRLHNLPFLMLDDLNEVRYQAEAQVSLLNLRLANVREQNSRAFQAAIAWGALNLALFSTLPLNGLYYETIPWSLPFLLALPALWWWTWGTTYRDGVRFFDWYGAATHRSLQEFRESAATLPDWTAVFSDRAQALLDKGRKDLARLDVFCLMSAPPTIGSQHLLEAEHIAANGRTTLRSVFMADMDDSHPVPVADLLPTEPSRIPHATRIYLAPA